MGRGGGNGGDTLTWTILQADARQIPLADKSVQCVVTSPPYWGLRDYWQVGQIGLEPTPEAYVAKIVAVFVEVWRVLRDDGTCWVNLGDSYNAGTNVSRKNSTNGAVGNWQTADETGGLRRDVIGLKPKDLVGIPWRVAFALQAAGAASPATMAAVDRIRTALLEDYDDWEQVPDRTRSVIEALDREWHDAHRGGWYLRSDIIWSKPNPMPESVTDRPTKAHEYIFLLTKRERYYFDQDAVREAHGNHFRPNQDGIYESPKGTLQNIRRCGTPEDGRNIRTVWEIATQPFPSAHFATFPEEIAIRCIKAGSKVGDMILDPFSGAGTVPLVADKLNRCGIGLELKADYCRMANRRCYDDAPLLSSAIIIV